MLDQQTLRDVESRCTQEAPPRCQEACPLRLDVRAFLEHMGAGAWAEARRVLHRHLPLPGIVARVCDHPCENVCLRRDLGGSLAIGALERFCVENAEPPRVLPRPRKEAVLAVLGNGLAGLATAYELSRKGFGVTVFHEEQPADFLLRRFTALEAAHVEGELQALRKAGVAFTQGLTSAAGMAEIMAGFAAAFVDADAAPHLAGTREQVDALTLLAGERLCCGGWPERTPTGHACVSASRQAGDGQRAALTLERLVTGVSLTASRPDAPPQRHLFTPLEGVEPQERVVPAQGAHTASEAQAEAARCLRCQCLACVRQCAYLREHGGYPRLYARQIHNNASIVKGLHTANALVNGCALCGQCTELCPERFSMADLCLSARRDMVRRDFMPPSAHEFALEDMESATGAKALFLGDASLPQRHAAWAFFPGCQLWAARGEQVLAVYRHLRQLPPGREGMGLILSCCGVPARWAGREELFEAALDDLKTRWQAMGSPALVVGCASCLKTFREALPQARLVSLWEMLDAHPLPPLPLLPPPAAPAAQGTEGEKAAVCAAKEGSPPAGAAGERAFPTSAAAAHSPQEESLTLSVHDPCAARHDAAWQGAVRSLARKRGIRLEEPPLTGLTTACCGYGGLVWNARPALAHAMSAARGAQLAHDGLASCIMCRDRLAASGKACWHVLDILGLGGAAAPDARGPGLSARRAGRAALRVQVLRRLWGREEADPPGPSVYISPELLEHLEERHILREDVEQAIAALEATGRRFQELESGHWLGAWRPRHVTFWVRYSAAEAGGHVLHDAWCHRMTVPGVAEECPSPAATCPPGACGADSGGGSL